MAKSVTAQAQPRLGRPRGALARRLRAFASLGQGAVGLGLAAAVVGLALIGPWLVTTSPFALIGAPFHPPFARALLGTDVLGRSVVARVLVGGVQILGLSVIATVLGVAVGGALGMAAGYLKGLIDEIIMRTLDVALAFPQTILALLFVSIVGPKPWLIALLVAAIHAPQVARVARAATLRLASEDFVLYAEMVGLTRTRIILTEIAPNIMATLLVELGLRFTYSIALIAGLSFLGLAEQPPAANWGLMINENRIGMGLNPWPVVVPAVLVSLLSVGMNLFADTISRRGLELARPRDDAAPVDADTLGASP